MNEYSLARQAAIEWERLGVSARVNRLQPAADALCAHMETLADVIHDENGKPRAEAIGHEILPAIAYVRWLGEEGPGILGPEKRPVKWLPHRRCVVERRPFGAVLVISPWNIPFLIPFSQVVTALAAGNAVVLKPSEITPRVAGWIEEILKPCGLPEGLFQIVQGDGLVGARLVEGGPDKVIFTGSVVTGRKVMTACSAQIVPVSLELGGIDAAIVLEDADLDYASSAVAWGGTFNHGQVCASVERLLVHESIYDEFLERVAEKMQRINPHEDLGRVTFEGQKSVINSHLTDCEDREMRPLCGGSWLSTNRLSPALFSDKAGESKVWKEETFGPIVVARPFGSDEEGIRFHNDTRYGLTASIFSRDLERAEKIARRLRAGCVAINELGAMHYSQPELPWGGVGDSGFGRSHGKEGLLSLTWPQVIDVSRTGSAEPKRPWWYPYNYPLAGALSSFAQVVGLRDPASRAVQLGKALKGIAHTLSHTPRN